MVFSTELFFIRYNNVTQRVLWVTSRRRVICTCMYLSSLDLTGLPGLLHQNNRVSLRGLCYIVSAWRSTYGLVLLLLHCSAKPKCSNCLLSKYAVTRLLPLGFARQCCGLRIQNCRAKPKGSICLLYK